MVTPEKIVKNVLHYTMLNDKARKYFWQGVNSGLSEDNAFEYAVEKMGNLGPKG